MTEMEGIGGDGVRSERQVLEERDRERIAALGDPRTRHELFRLAFFGISDLAAIADLETGSLIEINEGGERVLGWRRDELLGRRTADLPIWPNQAERRRVTQYLEEIVKTTSGEIPELEFEIIGKDGRPNVLAGSARLVEMGGRKRILLLLRDVTERKRAERARAQLACIVEYSRDAIIGVDFDGTVSSWNGGAEALYGHAMQDALGNPLSALIAHDAPLEIDRLLDTCREGRTIVNHELARTAKDGTPQHISITVSPIRDASGRVIGASAIARDVSERHRLEETLRDLNLALERRVRERTLELEREVCEHRQARESLSRSEQKYRDLVESANSIILRWDTKGRITFVNEFGQSYFGFHEAELLGRNVIGTIVPETESSGRDLIELMREVSTHPNDFIASENENIRRNGERVWVAWTNRPVLDASGKLAETLSVGNDITALKKVERELVRAKEAAESADRLKSAFLATMSHELRTPLNSIIGFTGILLQGLAGPLNDEQAKQLGMVQQSARHLHALINDVLDLSKIEAGQLRIECNSFDYPESATHVLREMEPLAKKKGLSLRLQVASGVGTITSDRRRVEQVLMNLLNNAIKFTDRGEVEVSCAGQDGWVETSVRDTGIGIRSEDQSILFRPFQQVDAGLTRRHEGTGLGLSICRKLLDLLGGTITFRSTPGAGSVFTFRLPQRAEAPCCPH